MPRIKYLRATPENMKRVYEPGVFALDLDDLSRYSAHPGDYWFLAPTEPLVNAYTNNALVLAREICTIEPAL